LGGDPRGKREIQGSKRERRGGLDEVDPAAGGRQGEAKLEDPEALDDLARRHRALERDETASTDPAVPHLAAAPGRDHEPRGEVIPGRRKPGEPCEEPRQRPSSAEDGEPSNPETRARTGATCVHAIWFHTL